MWGRILHPCSAHLSFLLLRAVRCTVFEPLTPTGYVRDPVFVFHYAILCIVIEFIIVMRLLICGGGGSETTSLPQCISCVPALLLPSSGSIILVGIRRFYAWYSLCVLTCVSVVCVMYRVRHSRCALVLYKVSFLNLGRAICYGSLSGHSVRNFVVLVTHVCSASSLLNFVMPFVHVCVFRW